MTPPLRAVLVCGAFALTAIGAPLRAQSQLFTVDRYAELERVESPQISPDGNHIVFTRSRVDLMSDRWVAALWEMEADGSGQRELVRGSDAQWSPDGTRIAYLAAAGGKDQLWVRQMDGDGTATQVTHGDASPMSFRWSPDSRTLAFTMRVADTVSWPIALPALPAGAERTPDPRIVTRLNHDDHVRLYPGDSWVHLFVVGIDGGALRQVTHGDFNIGAVARGNQRPALDWTLDGKTVIVDGDNAADADRHYRVSNLYAVDLGSGAMRLLTTDRGMWRDPVVSPDGKWIAYTGFAATPAMYKAADLFVMHPDGTAARALTTGTDRDPASVKWTDNETLIFTVESGGSVNTWTASLTGKAPFVKPASNGIHVLALSSWSIKRGIGVATRTTPHAPAEVIRFTLKKAWDLQQLTHVNDSMLAGIRLGDVEELGFTSALETKVQGWLVKPPGFDPQKHYPLILETNDESASMRSVAFNPSFQNFAAAGYLVLSLNTRGSSGYGSAFGNAIVKAYPGVDYDDLMAGVNDVISHGSVDTTRMYVGGGTLAAWVIGRTDRFAAVAARSPVVDWISLVGETELPLASLDMFTHSFWDDLTTWWKQSPLAAINTVTTPTLVMAGELDSQLPQSEELYAALKLRSVPTTLLRFAGEYHRLTSKPSNWMRAQLYMLSWYGKYTR